MSYISDRRWNVTRVNILRVIAVVAVAVGSASSVHAQQFLWFVDDDAAPGGDGLSWPTAFQDLQSALSEASSSQGDDQVWVAAGTYYADGGTGLPTSTLQLQNDVSIFGGFPPGGGDFADRDPALYETILSGVLSAAEPEGNCPNPNGGDCFTPTPGVPGCLDQACCEAVCLGPRVLL